jgi:O-antigen ligase
MSQESSVRLGPQLMSSRASVPGWTWLAIPLFSTLLVVALATRLGAPAAGLAAVVLGFFWSLRDIRIAYLVMVLLASFINYNGGQLAIELGILYGWIGWTALLTFWRGAWIVPASVPRAVLPALVLWAIVSTAGALLGLFSGNNIRILLIELGGVTWPVIAVLACRAHDRRSLALAGLGLVLISLVHTVFGLVWLKILGQRIGGIYFMPIPGFTAVGLWAWALLTPRRWWRWVAYAVIVALLTHQLFSFTRGYWLGILAGLVTATLLIGRKLVCAGVPAGHVGRRVVAGAATVAVIMVLASAVYFGDRGGLLGAAESRFQSAFTVHSSDETSSNIMRLAEYSIAAGTIRQSPWVGQGWGYLIRNRDPVMGTWYTRGFVHNLYLFLWLKVGLIGLGVFVYLMWRFCKRAWSQARSEPDWQASAWGISAVAMTVHALVIGLTNYNLSDFNTGIYMAFIWGIVWALDRGSSEPAGGVAGGPVTARRRPGLM